MAVPKWTATLDEMRGGLGDIHPLGYHITRHAAQRLLERDLPEDALFRSARGGRPVIEGRTVVTVIPHGRPPTYLPGTMFLMPRANAAPAPAPAQVRAPRNGGRAAAGVAHPPPPGQPAPPTTRVDCGDVVAVVIGKDKTMLRQLEREYGVSIKVVGPGPGAGNHVVAITPRAAAAAAADVDGAAAAVRRIVEGFRLRRVVRNWRARRIQRGGSGASADADDASPDVMWAEDRQTAGVACPRTAACFVIGAGGACITGIQRRYRVRMCVDADLGVAAVTARLAATPTANVAGAVASIQRAVQHAVSTLAASAPVDAIAEAAVEAGAAAPGAGANLAAPEPRYRGAGAPAAAAAVRAEEEELPT